MDAWKQAIWLAKFELRKSKSAIWMVLILLFGIAVLFFSMFESYLEKGFVGFDLFFMIAFGYAAVWGKPKEFQYQKIDENTWGSPLVISLSHLPIKREVLVRSRFIIFFAYSIPYQIALLLLTYSFTSELRELMTLPAYLVFSIIWLCFGFYFGGAFAAIDAGDRIKMSKSVVYAILIFILTMVGLSIFHLIYGNGIVAWTVMLANEWPFVSIVVSVVVAGLGMRYYKGYMYKKMEQVDYLK